MPDETTKQPLLLHDAFVVIPDDSVYGLYPYNGLQILGFAIIIFFIGLSSTVCGLRVYSRRLANGFGPDDWLIFLAMALAIPQAVTTSFVLRSGYWGIHDREVPKSAPANLGAFWVFLNGTFYSATLPLVKVSALLFLLRLGSTKRRVQIACWALITFSCLQVLTFLSITMVQCLPIESLWITTIKDKLVSPKCIRRDIYAISQSVVNIVTDALTVLIPLLIFLNLKLNRRVRNALLTVFLLGTLVTIISGVRLYYVVRLYYMSPQDRKFSIGYITSTVEINLAIVTASVPALWPLARRWFPGAFESLGISRPYLQPDIEVGYATQGGSCTTNSQSKTLKGKVTWHKIQRVPSGVPAGGGLRVAHGGKASIGSVERDSSPDEDDEIFGMTYHALARKEKPGRDGFGVQGHRHDA